MFAGIWGFGAPGDQNLAFPMTLASRFYNSLYYRTSRDCSMADFSFFKMAAVRHLGCLNLGKLGKLEISTSRPVRRPNMRHHTKFREDRSNRSRDIADFRFFKMAAAAILDY